MTSPHSNMGRTAPEGLVNTRKEPRRKVLKSAMIVYGPNGAVTMPCAVRDVSETGAKVIVQAAVDAPDAFDLVIELDGIIASCEVVRRDGETLGCQFTEPPRKFIPKRQQVVSMTASEKKHRLLRKPIRI